MLPLQGSLPRSRTGVLSLEGMQRRSSCCRVVPACPVSCWDRSIPALPCWEHQGPASRAAPPETTACVTASSGQGTSTALGRTMGNQGSSWRTRDLHGGPWGTRDPHGGPWRARGPHGEPWRTRGPLVPRARRAGNLPIQQSQLHCHSSVHFHGSIFSFWTTDIVFLEHNFH